MFDVGNEEKRVELHDNSPKPGSENKRFMHRIILLGVIVGLLIVAIILGAVLLTLSRSGQTGVIDDGGIPSSSEEDGGFLGLQNPGKLTDIEPTTDEDMQEEFENRPQITPSHVAGFETAINNYLTLGDFEGLDEYLKEQEQTYGGPAEEYAQSMEDWSGKFPLLRADTQAALYLIDKRVENPSTYFKNFSDPEILAATVAWSPMSCKLDAFLDYSALILPPPDEGDNINLEEYDYGSRVNEVLSEISNMAGAQYLDVKAYDMDICGHPVRVTVVMNMMGYYEPWSVQDRGGGLNPEIWQKTSIKNSEVDIYYQNSIDGVYFLSPPDELPSKKEHPDWFDQDGLYIGPVGGENAVVETPAAEGTVSETPADAASEDATAETQGSSELPKEEVAPTGS